MYTQKQSKSIKSILLTLVLLATIGLSILVASQSTIVVHAHGHDDEHDHAIQSRLVASYDANYQGYGNNPSNWYNDNLKLSHSPMISVLTHGLSSSASVWSNNYRVGISDSDFGFAYDSRSLIESLRAKSPTGATVVWAKMDKDGKNFKLRELRIQSQVYKEDPNTISRLTMQDLTRHVVVVFEASQDGSQAATNGSNDMVYNELRNMLNRLVLDVAYLTNGIYPKVNLIGHSRGGLTNLQYALDYPRLVSGLYSFGTPYLGTTSGSILNMLFQWVDLSQFGDSGFMSTQGYKDIINSGVYKSYLSRWNNNYSRYSHINAVAYGGYSSMDFVLYLIDTYRDTFKLNSLQILGIRAVVVAIATIDILGIFDVYDIVVAGLRGLFADCDIIALANFLTNEIVAYIQGPINIQVIVNLESDLLVDLGSQRASNGIGSYRGFVGDQKLFERHNANLDLRSQNQLPVVHNLEARDPELINKLLTRIDLGFDKYSVVGGSITGVVNQAKLTGLVAIPSTIKGIAIRTIDANALSNQTGLSLIILPSSTSPHMRAFSPKTKVTWVDMIDCYHHSNLSLSYSANAGGHTAKCHLCNQTIYNSHSFGGGVDRYQSCTTCGYMVDSWTDTITARIDQRPYISSLRMLRLV